MLRPLLTPRLPSLALLISALLGCTRPGGPVAGPADTHCGSTVVTVDRAACAAPAPPGTAEDPIAHFGTEADDDDCKYHVKFDVTPIYRDQEATFTVIATNKTDGAPVTEAEVHLEAFLNATHPAPNSNTSTTENPPGTYTVKPVLFDASGQWTVRFHFFEDCNDTEDSPHGHADFYVDVP